MKFSALFVYSLALCVLAALSLAVPSEAAQNITPAESPVKSPGQSPTITRAITLTWTISLYQRANAPAETATAKPTYTIGLFGQLVEVPSLKGKTWYEASVLLAQMNLVGVKISEAARKDDEVRNQDVAAGKKVFPGTRIKLDLVAKVPNVVGMSLNEAYELLEVENGFKAKYNPDWSADFLVTVQKPKAGATHRRGRDVDIASMVEVPNLVRMSIDEAKQVLTDAKLYADIPDYFEDSDRVLRQSVRAGKMVLALAKIRLTPGTEVPDLIGLNPNGVDRALRQAGLDGDPVFKPVFTANARIHGRTVARRQSIRAGNYVTRKTRIRVTFLRYVYRAPVVVPPPPVVGGIGGGGGVGGGG